MAYVDPSQCDYAAQVDLISFSIMVSLDSWKLNNMAQALSSVYIYFDTQRLNILFL